MVTLEKLLNMTIDGYDKDNNPNHITPDFRLIVQSGNHDGVKILIHPIGFNGETLDFVVKDNTLIPIN